MDAKSQFASIITAAVLGATVATVAAKLPAGTPEYRVHAMDLRAGETLDDGGLQVTAQIWADKRMPDGGWKDLGKGSPYAVDQAKARELLKDAESAVRE